MIKLSNIKKTFLTAIVATSMLATSLTALAAEEEPTDIPNVSKDGIYLDVTQNWTANVDLSKVNQKVTYTVTQDPTSTWYDETITLLPVEPASTDAPNTFVLKDNDDSAQLKLTAPHAGVFTFLIKVSDETEAAKTTGYTYDQDTYTIRAYVKTDDNGNLTVKTITAQKGDDNGKSASITFEHSFKGVKSNEIKDKDGNTIADPPVQKVVKGDEPRTKDEFEFSITPDEANPEKDLYPYKDGVEQRTITLRPSKELTAEFGDFTFSKAGTYKFYVREINNEIKGYTYDDEVYTVVYVVGEDKETNEFTCARYFIVDGEQVDTPVKEGNYYEFTNTFVDPDKRGGGSDDDHHHHHHDKDSSSAATTQQVVDTAATIETPADEGALDNGNVTEDAGDVGGATGDNSNMTLYAGIMVLAILALLGWFAYERKNREAK